MPDIASQGSVCSHRGVEDIIITCHVLMPMLKSDAYAKNDKVTCECDNGGSFFEYAPTAHCYLFLHAIDYNYGFFQASLMVA